MSVTEVQPGKIAFPELEAVEELIGEALFTSGETLREMVAHLLQARGKMLRPILVLLSSAVFNPEPGPRERAALLRVAAAVELIHTASLVHDDIIDNASRRRGAATLHRRWSKREAVLAGDFFLSRAFLLLCAAGERNVLLPLLARSVALLCRGEISQLERRHDWEIGERSYFHYNYLKTSQFLAACCEAGGRLARAAAAQIGALRRYGFYMGQAFQIVDDIIDYAGEETRTGKTGGSDLGQGVVTLPLIYLLREGSRYREMLRAVGRTCALPAALQEQLRQAVRNGGALRYASRKAFLCKEAALTALRDLPPARARHLLEQVAEAVAARTPPV